MSRFYKRRKLGKLEENDKSDTSVPNSRLIDEKLYEKNYAIAERLKRRLLAKFDLESHSLPCVSFRKVVDHEIAPKAPLFGGKRSYSTEDKCCYCISKQENFNAISHSNMVYLTLDSRRNAILRDQILIIPFQHAQSTLNLDEDTYTEIRNYQKTIVRMFFEVEKAVIFVEMSRSHHGPGGGERGTTGESRHCKIECFAIPKEMMDYAKCSFRRELDEAISEWAQNREVLSIHGKRGVRGTIPPSLDFIHIDYSLSGEGIACVIDNDSNFPPSFSRDIIASILKIDSLERAYNSKDAYDQAFSCLKKQYKDYDWTNLT